MTDARPKHISEKITEEEDDKNWENAGVNWSRNYLGEVDNSEYVLHFGTPSDTLARIKPTESGHVQILINERFPDLGYDGILHDDYDPAMKHVHEWWSTVFHIVVNTFDKDLILDGVDLENYIECFSLKLLKDEDTEYRHRKAAEYLQRAISADD